MKAKSEILKQDTKAEPVIEYPILMDWDWIAGQQIDLPTVLFTNKGTAVCMQTKGGYALGEVLSLTFNLERFKISEKSIVISNKN